MQAKESREKRWDTVLFVIAAVLAAVLTAPPSSGDCKSGIAGRALEKRAAEVTEMKNTFVAKVLLKERIPYRVNETGAVVLIQVEGKWEPIEKIDIIPVLRDDGKGDGIVAHELYFTTANGVYRLVSDMAIRKK